MFFRGTYDHTLDSKNRLTVPVRFRGELASGVVVARGIETCVTVWAPAAFDEWSGSIVAALGPLTQEARDFRRVVSASAFETELDAAGRVMLPVKLIEYACIERECSVVGNHEHFEIWNRDTWNDYDAVTAPTIPELAGSIGTDG